MLPPSTDIQPTDIHAQAIDDVLRFVVRFGLTLPAILCLETLKPLSRMGSQFMHILSPSICVFLSPAHWKAFANILEEPNGTEYLLRRLEHLDRQSK